MVNNGHHICESCSHRPPSDPVTRELVDKWVASWSMDSSEVMAEDGIDNRVGNILGPVTLCYSVHCTLQYMEFSGNYINDSSLKSSYDCSDSPLQTDASM